MTLLGEDLHTQLAFAIYENPGVFAVLLGSGLSRSAEIPTGWEITVDLIRRVALAKGVEPQADWDEWYRREFGQEPNYSTLLEELSSSRAERRSILHSYIEPSDDDREEGRKIPTPAHAALADLVSGGQVRVIITTNFDRLMENALRERGMEPTVVASVDALKGAEPIVHSNCYILKLHGDYKDARQLNTDTELSSYPDEYDALLDRIFDEYGLIVCGWSGEWDHALRRALLRAPNRRFPVYWAARGTSGGGATDIINHRAARVIEITDADSFFSSVREKVRTLGETHRKNPLGVELLVSSVKRYLARPEHRIHLDELVTTEAGRLVDQIDSPISSATGQFNTDEFRKRISIYEAATEPLARVAGVLGRWGDGAELTLVLDMLRAVHALVDKGGGTVLWLNLRAYPAVLIFTAYALGLTRSHRWQVLHGLLESTIPRKLQEPTRVVETLFLWAWEGGRNEIWQQIEGLERRKTPLSDHLLQVFEAWSSGFVGLGTPFEDLFERFEVLASLAYLESVELSQLEQALADQTGQNRVWTPVGRSCWNSSVRERVLSEVVAGDLREALLKAGFANGDGEFLAKSIANYKRNVGHMHW